MTSSAHSDARAAKEAPAAALAQARREAGGEARAGEDGKDAGRIATAAGPEFLQEPEPDARAGDETGRFRGRSSTRSCRCAGRRWRVS